MTREHNLDHSSVCDTCDGSGTVTITDVDVVNKGTRWQRSAEYKIQIECPTCNGNGRITQQPQQDTTANEIDIRARHIVYRDELIKQLGETASLCKSSVDNNDRVLLSIADSFTFLRSYLINQQRMEDSKP